MQLAYNDRRCFLSFFCIECLFLHNVLVIELSIFATIDHILNVFPVLGLQISHYLFYNLISRQKLQYSFSIFNVHFYQFRCFCLFQFWISIFCTTSTIEKDDIEIESYTYRKNNKGYLVPFVQVSLKESDT